MPVFIFNLGTQYRLSINISGGGSGSTIDIIGRSSSGSSSGSKSSSKKSSRLGGSCVVAAEHFVD